MADALMTEYQIKVFVEKILQLAPKRVLEIGSYQGGSAEIIRKAIGKQNTLVCVDPKPMFDPKKIPTVLIQSPFHEAFNFEEVDEAQKFDLVFHDAEHNYEGVLRDLRLVKKVVKEGGVVLIHDCGHPPTMQAIEQIISEGVFLDGGPLAEDYTFVNDVRWGGLWILQA